MLPLSTPTTSGLWVDWLTLAVVLSTLGAFAAGVSDLWSRLRGVKGAAMDPVALAAYAALSLVGLAVVVMIGGARGVPVAQAAFLAVAARGVLTVPGRVRRAGRWWARASGADVIRAAAFIGAAVWSLVFWTTIYRDHVALPAFTDGITHTVYYLRIVETGMPTLGRVSIGWDALFGRQLFPFYPTGSHALVAIASGFWGQWGVISHAGILKAWFTLALAAMPWALFWFVRRLMPAMPWWIGVALIFLATPGFRFPLEVAHEGGLARLFAHVAMTPIYADVIAGRFGGPRSRLVAGLVLGAAFLMHPSTCVAFAAVLAYATLFAAVDAPTWRRRAAAAASGIAALAIGGLIAVAILRWNGGAPPPPKPVQVFSWAALASRLATGWGTLFTDEYGTGPIKEMLIVAGLVALLVGRRAFGLPWRVALYPVLMTGVAVVSLAALLLPLPGFRALGGAFYDEVPRVIELMYESIGVCLVALAWAVWQMVAGCRTATVSSYRAKMATAGAAVLVMSAVLYQHSSRVWIADHVLHWDGMFSTARISRLHTLGRWIEENTEPHALLFYAPFDAEVWQAWTGRRGMFMYGECHMQQIQHPCETREMFVTHRLDTLDAALVESAPGERCLRDIDSFGRPAYFIVKTAFVSTRPFPVCRDATYVATLDGHAVFTYRNP